MGWRYHCCSGPGCQSLGDFDHCGGLKGMGEKGRLRLFSFSEVLMIHTFSSEVGRGNSTGLKTLSALCLLGLLKVCGYLPHRLEGQALGSSHPVLSPESTSKWKKCSPSQGSGVQGQMHLWLSKPTESLLAP